MDSQFSHYSYDEKQSNGTEKHEKCQCCTQRCPKNITFP